MEIAFSSSVCEKCFFENGNFLLCPSKKFKVFPTEKFLAVVTFFTKIILSSRVTFLPRIVCHEVILLAGNKYFDLWERNIVLKDCIGIGECLFNAEKTPFERRRTQAVDVNGKNIKTTLKVLSNDSYGVIEQSKGKREISKQTFMNI